MEISQQIESVYQRALLLRQYAMESPVHQDLLEKALQELYFVLEELQTSQEELHLQNQELIAARQSVDLERQCYQVLFEIAPNGYLVTDLKGNILRANQYAVTRLFYTPQEYLISKPLLVFIHKSDRPSFRSQMANLTFEQDWEVILTPPNEDLIKVAIAVARIPSNQRYIDMLMWSINIIANC